MMLGRTELVGMGMMFHAPCFYTTLGISEEVVEPTAYELLDLPPRDLQTVSEEGAAVVIERALGVRKRRLRIGTPGLPSVPVVVRMEGKLDTAAKLLLDPEQRRAYDTHLASRSRERALRAATARHRKLAPAVHEAVEAALAADGTLADGARPSLVKRLQAIKVSDKNIESILAEIPRPVAAPAEPTRQTLSFFTGAVDLVIGQGGLSASDEFELGLLAERLAIPAQYAAQIVQQRLGATGVPRTDAGTASRQVRLEEQLRKLYPGRVAGPKQRADLLTLAVAQGMRVDEAQRVIQAYFAPPVVEAVEADVLEAEAVQVAGPAADGEGEVLEAILVVEGEPSPPPESGVSALKQALARHAARSTRRHKTGKVAERPAQTAWGLWVAVSVLAAAAALLTAILVFVSYFWGRPREERLTPGPPAPVEARPAGQATALAGRLAEVAGSRPDVLAAVRSAPPSDVTGALRELARLAADPRQPSSANATMALAQIAQDLPGSASPEEAKWGARLALCDVIRNTEEADAARRARALLVCLIQSDAPRFEAPTDSLQSNLATPQERRAAADALEKAILAASTSSPPPW